MFLKKIAAGMAVTGLATAPVMAQSVAPTTAPIASENALGGEDNGGIIALIAVLAALTIGAFTLIDDDEPVSP